MEQEPALASRVPRGIHSLLAELNQPLRVREAPLFFRMSRGREEKYFSRNVLRPEFTAAYFRRVIPERGGLRLDHLADHQPLQPRQGPPLQLRIRPRHRGV